MATAKISGLATYHKCIKDLHAFGYIQYKPSYNPGTTSKVYLLLRHSADACSLYKQAKGDGQVSSPEKQTDRNG